MLPNLADVEAGDRENTTRMANRDRQHCYWRACRKIEELFLAKAQEVALDAAANEVVNAKIASAVAKRIARVIA